MYSFQRRFQLLNVSCKVVLNLNSSSKSDEVKRKFLQLINLRLCAQLRTIDEFNPGNYKMETQQMSSTMDSSAVPKSATHSSGSADQSVMSKRALKRQARAQKFKQSKKQKKDENSQTEREEVGFNLGAFDQTSYYFENGLRKVYPYHYVFATYAKGRWVGRTLKNVLENEFGFDEPGDVDKAFHQGKIHVNGVQASNDYVVKDCAYISHQIHRHENPVTDRSLEVLADTEEVVVINKPSSIPSHPCGRYRFNSVVFILGKEMGYSNLRNIYRLDRLTSGVLLMGKTAKATKKLEDQVVKRQVQKEYVCRVMGEFPSETVTVDQPLQALSNKLRLQVVSSTGKPSQTTFSRLSYNGRSSVVKCFPRTGRTHQIRVHLQFLGHPIINDVFYNSNAWGPNKGKGGVYEISSDIVCDTILKRHQKTQWDGGDNPLFFKKLKEMQQKQEVNDSQNNHQNKQCQNSESIQKQEDETQRKENDCTIPGRTGNIDHISSEAELNLHSASDKDCNDPHIVGCNDTNSSSTHLNVEDKEIEADDLNAKADSATSTAIDFSQEAKTRVGFDWTKWQVDESCDMCRKTTLDPKPRDLVMFLHALKYKGPDWEYQTEMPDWAHEDWQDEDQYILEEKS